MNRIKTIMVSSFTILLFSIMMLMSKDYFTSDPARIIMKALAVISAAVTCIFFILDIKYTGKDNSGEL